MPVANPEATVGGCEGHDDAASQPPMHERVENAGEHVKSQEDDRKHRDPAVKLLRAKPGQFRERRREVVVTVQGPVGGRRPSTSATIPLARVMSHQMVEVTGVPAHQATHRE